MGKPNGDALHDREARSFQVCDRSFSPGVVPFQQRFQLRGLYWASGD